MPNSNLVTTTLGSFVIDIDIKIHQIIKVAWPAKVINLKNMTLNHISKSLYMDSYLYILEMNSEAHNIKDIMLLSGPS